MNDNYRLTAMCCFCLFICKIVIVPGAVLVDADEMVFVI